MASCDTAIMSFFTCFVSNIFNLLLLWYKHLILFKGLEEGRDHAGVPVPDAALGGRHVTAARGTGGQGIAALEIGPGIQSLSFFCSNTSSLPDNCLTADLFECYVTKIQVKIPPKYDHIQSSLENMLKSGDTQLIVITQTLSELTRVPKLSIN